MKTFVAVTDNEWFEFLAAQEGIDEVNFWQPGGGRDFKALSLGGPLLFKLHWPLNFIAGGGFFFSFTRLPVSIAWDTFGIKNGAPSYARMRELIENRRSMTPGSREDYDVGCIVLQDPFFLPRHLWIPAPDDFAKSVVQGKSYDLASPTGQALWDRVLGARALVRHVGAERPPAVDGPVWGEGQLGRIRLGQGAFRVLVTDAYGRRCAISGEKALPVLEAAHIMPVADGGQHRLDNGLLLRSDVHTLFDRGYITVTPKHRVLVAKKQLKDDFDNGEPYCAFHDTPIHMPAREPERPSAEFLEWHSDTVFRG